jgi:D-3-phosphoglycerate dehydrogenase
VKVLVADKFEESGKQGLKDIGCELLYEPDANGDPLTALIEQSGADVLVVRSTQVTRAMLEKGRLALVVRAGAGYNTIDVEAASERGIWVCNCPGKNAIAVCELAFGLVLASDRRIPDNTADLRKGVWNKKEYSKARGLYGLTLGLLGAGAIGREMMTRAKAFGMNVVAWDKVITKERAAEMEIGHAETPADLARRSDVVSVHLALNPETRGLCDEAFFAAMKHGALFVNTARGEIVDEAAMRRAIEAGRIRAAVDVFDKEPSGGTGTVESPLFALQNVIGTHHIGASTEQAQEAIAHETVRIVRLFKETGRAPHVVNLAKKSPATHMLVLRHFDRVGVLAAVFDKLKGAGINVQETENIVFEGAKAAVARIALSQAPAGNVLTEIRGCSDAILEASLVAI